MIAMGSRFKTYNLTDLQPDEADSGSGLAAHSAPEDIIGDALVGEIQNSATHRSTLVQLHTHTSPWLKIGSPRCSIDRSRKLLSHKFLAMLRELHGDV